LYLLTVPASDVWYFMRYIYALQRFMFLEFIKPTDLYLMCVHLCRVAGNTVIPYSK